MSGSPAGDEARELHLERWVTGGVCIAHAEGRTWFVRFGIPGETVRATVTRRARGVTFADATEVIVASPHRVTPPCEHFGPGLCGGCDLQHVEVDEQRRLKRVILADSLGRIGGLGDDARDVVEVTRAIPDDPTGLRWRTRVSGVRCTEGIGLHRWRSGELVDVHSCPICVEGLIAAASSQGDVGDEVRAAVGGDGRVGVEVNRAESSVVEHVTTPEGTCTWRIPVSAFWQVHRGAAQYLGDSLLALLDSVAGEDWWDLYAGVGLFAAFLDGAGASSVDMVESNEKAIRSARRAFHDRPHIRIHHSGTREWLEGNPRPPSGVVVDPPRRGCEPEVLDSLILLRPERIAYVSCDPASLGRDTARLIAGGFVLSRVVPIDAFPMTHHVEAIALFHRDDRIS